MVIIPIIILITLHGPNGQEIDINPNEVSSIRELSSSVPEGHFPKGTRCLVIMSNNRVTAVNEDCGTVRALLEGEHK